MNKDKGYHRILIDLPLDQYEAIQKVARQNSMTKVGVIRMLCGLLVDMDPLANILIYDREKIRGLQNLCDPVDFVAEPAKFSASTDEATAVSMNIAYSREDGVKVSGYVSVERRFDG